MNDTYTYLPLSSLDSIRLQHTEITIHTKDPKEIWNLYNEFKFPNKQLTHAIENI